LRLNSKSILFGALVVALFAVFAAFGLKTDRTTAAPLSITATPASPILVGSNYTVTAVYLDDTGGTTAVVTATEGGAGGVGLIATCTAAPVDVSLTTAIVNSATATTDTCTVAADTDTVTETTTVTVTYTCVIAGTVTFSLTEATVTLSTPPVACVTVLPTATSPAATNTPVILTASTITATPATIEIVPVGNSQLCSIIRVRALTSSSTGLNGLSVFFSTPQGILESDNVGTVKFKEGNAVVIATGVTTTESTAVVSAQANDAYPQTEEVTTASDPFDVTQPLTGVAEALFCAGGLDVYGNTIVATPGPVTITAVIEFNSTAVSCFTPTPTTGTVTPCTNPEDFIRTTVVNVVGPATTVTVDASPKTLICGEKSTITGTALDSARQNVSDFTAVGLTSNHGSVIAGASVGGPSAGGVTDVTISFGGKFTAYLLTGNEQVGPYEVVATVGGAFNPFLRDVNNALLSSTFQYFVPLVSAQVTVTCSLTVPAAAAAVPTIAAPRTGTGSISAPNTGDAGLADSSGSSLALYLVAGMVVFSVAGLAFKYARR